MKSRVLLIDDELVLLRATTRVLSKTFEVVAVSTADEAVAQASAGQVDVVISDFSMPGQNGVQLARRLREAGFHGLYLLLTAVSDSTELTEAIGERLLDGVIAKPWEPGTLCDQVSKLLATRVSSV